MLLLTWEVCLRCNRLRLVTGKHVCGGAAALLLLGSTRTGSRRKATCRQGHGSSYRDGEAAALPLPHCLCPSVLTPRSSPRFPSALCHRQANETRRRVLRPSRQQWGAQERQQRPSQSGGVTVLRVEGQRRGAAQEQALLGKRARPGARACGREGGWQGTSHQVARQGRGQQGRVRCLRLGGPCLKPAWGWAAARCHQLTCHGG